MLPGALWVPPGPLDRGHDVMMSARHRLQDVIEGNAGEYCYPFFVSFTCRKRTTASAAIPSGGYSLASERRHRSMAAIHQFHDGMRA